MIAVFVLLLLALAFVYINGFHDTGNSIATVVATRALTPAKAVLLATITNLAGALVGTAVAATVAYEIVDPRYITVNAVIAALIGAIVWDLLTWWWGLPTSSSHALLGGLCGAALAATGKWSEIIWHAPGTGRWWESGGIVTKVIVPMVASPLVGFSAAFMITGLFYVVLRNWPVTRVDRVFGKLQIFSGGYIGFAHGSNDAQKTVGVVILGLVAATNAGMLEGAPPWLGFLRHAPEAVGQELKPGLWLQVACALALAAGTAAAGWRVIRTMAHRITDLKPIHGFTAETTAALALTGAAALGFPVSTTHTITAAVGGVGASRRFSALRTGVINHILLAWLFTFPCAALVAYAVSWALRGMGAK